ncbi:MAG: DUF5009 domain-containing protein, partial [Cyclobacteriaceae bacterium]|nr:DUF5009 domain-containing protein [Cyclobacteriaceae bacterium HetDA_MAG_MS6]
ASFAILLQHFRPHQIMASPDTNAWLLALIGFVLLFGIYGKLPKNQPPWLIWLIKLLSATGAAVFVFNVSFQEEDFSLYRSDIILLILTNVYFFTAILWWLTRSKPAWRWLVLLILVGFSLSKDDIEFLTKIYGFSPLPWLYQFEYLEYLLLALPGVMVGEWLQRLNPETSKSETRNQWFLATHLLLICCMTLVGLQSRWIWLSFGASSILLFVVFRFRRQSHFYQLLLYGILFWVLGYLAEPLDGGIKKDPATLSYFLVTAGLSIFLLLVLVSMEKWWKSSRFYQLLVANGKNPMIAYVAFANFIWPILAITGLEKWINHWTDDPWTGMIKALAYTVLLALLIGFFTKKKLFWKT